MKIKLRRVDKIGLVLGVLSLLIHWFCPSHWVEVVYGRFIFPFFSWIFDHSIGILPFPFLYVLILLVGYLLYRFYRHLRLVIKNKTWVSLLIGILSTIGFILGAFYFFWGFNYDRVQLGERLSWQISSISNETLMQEANDQITRLRSFSGQQREKIEETLAFRNYRLLEVAIRQDAAKWASDLGYLARNRVRCRQLWPAGILLRIGTAGFYNPLSGECNIDKGLHPLQKPFSMAHEFFHGMGVTGEGDCNFLAYLLCNQSNHPFIRYSGELGYWRYMRHTVYMSDQDQYKQMVSQLPESVIDDMKAIDEQLDKFPDIAPRMRDAIYSAYLKSNKIHDGLANYNRILQLVINWRLNGGEL
ncbi:MAG: DUF3810 domain-containing protein [Saprospiraceae bacterium]|nr:DUF3810 domain-containing protein [Saprospiraceae bacterium]